MTVRQRVTSGVALTVVVLALASFVGSQTRTAAGAQRPSEYAPRYQLVPTHALFRNGVGATSSFETVFLVDTQTGRVWHFEHGKSDAADGTVYHYPQHMESVFVDKLDGDYVKQQVWTTKAPTAPPTPPPTQWIPTPPNP